MNIVLWLLQVVLGIKFVSVGLTHGIRHDKAEMAQGIQKMGKPARPLLIVVAIVTVLGGAGLVAPAALRLPGWLAPLSAALLGGLMLLSIVFHINCREKPHVFVSVILFAMAALVAYGRWMILPLA